MDHLARTGREFLISQAEWVDWSWRREGLPDQVINEMYRHQLYVTPRLQLADNVMLMTEESNNYDF